MDGVWNQIRAAQRLSLLRVLHAVMLRVWQDEREGESWCKGMWCC